MLSDFSVDLEYQSQFMKAKKIKMKNSFLVVLPIFGNCCIKKIIIIINCHTSLQETLSLMSTLKIYVRMEESCCRIVFQFHCFWITKYLTFKLDLNNSVQQLSVGLSNPMIMLLRLQRSLNEIIVVVSVTLCLDFDCCWIFKLFPSFL